MYITCFLPSPASFLFEGISSLEIKNTAIVSCGGGGSSGALQVRSVQQFYISNVTLQESASVSLNVQDSNGLVTGARFIGNTGAGMNTTNSTVVFEGNNTFSDNLDSGIASYNGTLQFSGVNQFTNNAATSTGGGISAIKSTINCSGNMMFECNSAEQYGGGVYASGTRMISNGQMKLLSNTVAIGGAGLFAGDNSIVDFRGIISFINNTVMCYGSCGLGGGIYATVASIVNISGSSNFIDNSAQRDGGGVCATNDATVDISGTSNFLGNSAHYGGGIRVWNWATAHVSGTSNFIGNSANGDGGGVHAEESTVNIRGTTNFINNSAAANGGGVYAFYYAIVNISGTSHFVSNSAGFGGGVSVYISTVSIRGANNITNNSAQWHGGGVYAHSYAKVDINGTNNFTNNSAQVYGGGVYARDATVDIRGISSFITNSAQCGGGVSLYQSVLHIRGNNSFTRNSANVKGGGTYAEKSCTAYFSGHTLFSENWSQYGGGVSLQQSVIVLRGNVAFSNNSASYGGAMQAFDAKINITGSGNFTSNLATANGGALALAGESVINIFETGNFLNFIGNLANSFGGAIYIEDSVVHCSYDWNINGFLGYYDSTRIDLCFYACWLENSHDKINISFTGNSAVAGSVIFGGEIEKTLSNIEITLPLYHNVHTFDPTVEDLFHYVFNVLIDDTNAPPTISSNPNRICRCISGQPDFSDPPSPYEVSVYPGQTVGVSLVAVGQRNGTVPSTITAMYDPDDGATFRDLQSTQRIDQTTCTEIYYSIFSRKETETFKIYVDESCGVEGVPLSVSVMLLECPSGFTLSNSSNQCVCEERLQKYTSSCNISNLEITRTASETFWVGVDNTNGSEGLILHPHCPFDYCRTDTVHFTLVENPLIDSYASTNSSMSNTNTTVAVLNGTNTHFNATLNDTDATDYAIGNNIDAQCNYNRSGLLCGKCQKGLSIVFGGSKCLKCSNSYLSLLIVFALAGFVLVIFLFVLKLTVAVGTINGLVFYANIVSVNRAQLFPLGETNILTVFIAWLNLDLGIETCFFDGMDAYSKAWLQYAFPIYVWVLVGAIILASRHSTIVARNLGSNPVAVLATLFLLSYAKLLHSIINPLFVTLLEYPSDSKAVWLIDGNVPYLKGKHIPLFLTSLLALFLLFIPFTLLLLLGQWIQAQSERKCCSWISDYRVSTILDVYHGPFKNKHRYWCGLLLVTRFCLFVVFAVNVNGDPSVNILAIAVSLYGILVLFVWFKVYKTLYLNVLEVSFIFNLSLLATGTSYVDIIAGGSQDALTYTSVSVAFATFCGIVVYHSYLQTKDSKLFKKLVIKKFIHSRAVKSSADDYGAEDVEEDPPRKYTKPPTTSVVEITK